MSNPRWEGLADLPVYDEFGYYVDNPQVPKTMIITSPSGKTWTEVASLNIMALGRRSYLQGAYYHDGYWYLVQSKVVSGSREDIYIRRFRDAGSKTVAAYMDTMVLEGAGHGSIVGIRNRNGKPTIWLVWKSRGKIARVRYIPGTIKADNRGISWVSNVKSPGANCGLFEDWLFTRRPRTIAGIKYEDWSLYRISDIEGQAGLVKPINTARVIFGGTFQGGAANGVYFTRMTGKTSRRKSGTWFRGKVKWDRAHKIVFYDWATGKAVRTIDVSDMGPRIAVNGALEPVTSKEPEGMQYRGGNWYAGFRLGSVNNRRFRIFRINP